MDIDRWELLLAREAVTASARTGLATACRSGELVRVSRGAYLPAARWHALDPDERFRARLQAIATTTDPPPVFSHASAAALWRLPWIGAWPARADAVAGPDPSVTSTPAIRRHRVHAGDPVVIDGVLVTDLARTVADLARSGDLVRAVAVADAALNEELRAELPIRQTTPLDLLTELDRTPLRHGSARLRHVIEFADGRSGSAGESLSRVVMARLRIEPPQLQQPFPRAGGGRWYVDFWWPGPRVIGEFDGKAKYLDERQRAGRTAAQVVFDEKVREDELRRQSQGFVRWDWAIASDPARLLARLQAAGVPRSRR